MSAAQSRVSSFLLITSLQPKCFDELTHSFAQRRRTIPRIINRFRTLSIATGVVPPLECGDLVYPEPRGAAAFTVSAAGNSPKSRGSVTSDRILNSTMAQIASRIAQLNGEGALSVFARAKELEKQGRSIIHLELGEPDFHPAAPVVDALRTAIAAGRDRYVSPRGSPGLREAVAGYPQRT